MAGRRRTEPEEQPSRRNPATTPERRENQLVHLAVELAEKQLREGTASAQVISHYLKLGSTREQLEQARLRSENELMQAKIEAMASAVRSEALFEQALRAMKRYSGERLDTGDADED